MKCLRCGFESAAEMLFCGKCGSGLTPSCDPSGKTHPLEEQLARIRRYLPPALTKKILGQNDRIEGERRQVTVMFCDMKGFTPLAHQLGPEDTFALIERILGVMIRSVHQFEGTVNKTMGDGILALFGALDALEDAPHRAIWASMAIHKGIAGLNAKIKKEFRIPSILLRIGINTGPVVIGTIRTDLSIEFTSIGDTVNMASRMEGLAEPGTTYLTEETYRLAKDLFHFQPLGKKVVNGRDEPVPVYRLISARGRRVPASSGFGAADLLQDDRKGRRACQARVAGEESDRGGGFRRQYHRRGRHWKVAAPGRVETAAR